MVDKKELYDDAIRIAAAAHAYQRDLGGDLYILHPLRVSMACDSIDAKIVAVLHDTLEDTMVTVDYLIDNGFPKEIVDAVVVLTRRKNESYSSYIDRIKLNPIAKEVKTHDIEDNLNIKRLDKFDERDLKRLNKYIIAYKSLTNNN